MRLLLLLVSILCFHFSTSQTISPSGPINICPGESQLLTVTGTGTRNIQWQLNGVDISGANGNTYTATAAGNYSVDLTGGGPPTTSNIVLITVRPNPVAGFTSTPNNQCGNIPVIFTNTTTPSSTYQWNFGDVNSGTNNTSTNANPSHTFVGAFGNGTQNFTVSLTATTSFGCTNTITNSVTTKQIPDATLGGNGYGIYNGRNYFKICNNAATASFTFTNQSTTTATNTNYQIVWGDASPDFTAASFTSTTHTYNSGTSTLLFIVTGANGCIDTTTYFVFLGGNPAIGLGNPGNTSICTSNTLTFPISGGSANSPATVYSVTFNDNTPPLAYTHPAPASVSHTFLTSSCGTTTPQYPNSFSASIQASNACASSTATVVPIYVSEKATPSFTISPRDTVCVNSNVSFTNTTGANTNNDNGVCTLGKIIWQISPATGWTLTSGTFGNDFGLTDPSLWTAGSDVLGINFTVPGNYTIKIITGNTICGIDQLVKTICVNPTPTGTLDVNTNLGCAPLTVNTTTTTNTPFCGVNKYSWNVTYVSTSGCIPATSSFNYMGGTNSSSPQPVFQFLNPGVYTISMVVLAPAEACSSQIYTQQITVKGKPVVTLNSLPATNCQNASVNPTANVTCYVATGTTYNWSFPGGTPSSSASANPGNVIYSSPGNYTISLSVTNECGTTSTSTPVTVNPTPSPVVPANLVRCAGNTVGPLSFSSTTPGSIFSWTNSNTAIGLTSNGTGSSIGIFTIPTTITSTIVSNITVTASLNGCSSQNSFTITASPIPAAPTATAIVNYCQNATATPLSATAASGNTLLWYTSATGGTGSAIAPTPVTTAIGTFQFYVSQVISATGCEGPRRQITVNVNPSPNISGSSSINPITCGASTGSITLTGLVSGTVYTINYTFNGSPQTATITSTSGTIVIPNLPAGIYDNFTVSALGCTSNAVGPISLSDPSTPATPVAGTNSPLCSGGTISLTASTTSPGTATYTWTGPGGFSSASQNPNLPATVAANGSYLVTVRINGCTSLPGSVSVVVNATPALPTVTSNSPLCSGNSINLNSTTTFTGLLLYNWTGPNGFTSADEDPIIPNATTANSGIYSLVLTGTTGSCASTAATLNVVVNPTPVIANATSANPSLCATANGSITLTGLANGTSYTVTYTSSSGPQSTSISSNASGTLIIGNLPAGTYSNIRVTTLAGCVSTPVGPFTLTDPTAPASPTIANGGGVCSGGTINLTSTAGPTGTTYNWTGPLGYTSNSQNPVISSAAIGQGGTYTLTITVAGCTSAPVTTNVVVNQTPAVITVTSNSPVCTGNSINLNSSTTFSGPVTFNWIGPNGFSSTDQNPTLTGAALNNGGDYVVTITATTGNCPSLPGTIPVIVRPTPAIGTPASANPSQCASATGSITLPGLTNGAIYTVSYSYNTVPQPPVNLTAVGGSIVLASLLSGTYSNIIVTLDGCPSAPAGPVILVDPNPPTPPTAGSNSSICIGTTLNLTAATNILGGIFSWTGPNSFSSADQNPSILSVDANAAGMYYVSVQLNNCTSLTDSVFVVINPLGLPPIAPSPVTYCKDAISVPLTASVQANNTLNWYNVATGGTPLPSAPVPSTILAGLTSYYVSQTTSFGCEGTRTMVDVRVNPDAKALFTPTDTTGCPPFLLTPSIINLQEFPANNSTYNWFANGVFIGSGSVFPGYTINNENDSILIKLEAVSAFGCKNDSMNFKFYTFKLPYPAFVKDTTLGCGPITVQFTNTTPNINLFTYQWDFGNGQTSSDVQPPPIVFQPNPNSGDTVYVIKLKVFSICDTLIYSDSVRVQSKPRALFTPSNTNGCSPMRVLFDNNSLGLNNTYYWNFDDGTTLVTTSDTTFAHTFNTGFVDTFFVKLVVVNNCGSDSIVYNIIASPLNIAINLTVNGTEQSGCAPHTLAFINNTFGAGNFEWNFGDGNILSTTEGIDTVYHTYINAGTYTVSMQALNNCTDTTVIRTINVYPKPTVDFNASQVNACIGQPIQFNNLSANATSYQWFFGDGNSSTLVNPLHPYASAGTYTVKLIAIRANPGGTVCSDSTERVVQVTISLPGTISVSAVTSPCAPLTVTFVNRDRPSASVSWDFGDGNTATGDSVIHTYTTPGVYSLNVIVVNITGCTYLSNRTITVGGPAGSFTYSGGYICFPATVRFDANASGTNTFVWDFGDGLTETTTTSFVFHTYSNPGTYLPTVTLQSNGGCSLLISGIDSIKVDKLDAGFAWNTQNNCGSTRLTFTDTSFAYFGIAQTTWDFGDGNTGSGSVVNHVYTVPGTYPVVMTVTGTSGCAKSITTQVTITVNDIPNASIIGPATACTRDLIEFTANISSVNAINITGWLLSNGATGNGNNFSYLFNLPGTYTVRLITNTIFGCADTAFHNIVVNPSPVVSASGSVNICLGASAQLNATGAPTYQWTPSDGLSCTDCASPLSTPLVTTPYVVIGSNSFGCTDRDTVVITVNQPFTMIRSPDDSICIGQSTNLLVSGGTSYRWTPATGLSSTTVQNPIASPTVTTRYRVVAYDGLNCFTDTAFILVGVGQYPTVSLGPDRILSTGTVLPLTTTITNGPISIWAWSPTADLSCSDCPLPLATIKTDITYNVSVTTAYGCSATDNMSIKTFCNNAQVFIPNAFTPDGDGFNDVLMVRATGIATVKTFRIFSRWGEVVFERSDFKPNDIRNGWDGRIKGKAIGSPDVFVYTAEVICDNGTSYTYKGNTSIIK